MTASATRKNSYQLSSSSLCVKKFQLNDPFIFSQTKDEGAQIGSHAFHCCIRSTCGRSIVSFRESMGNEPNCILQSQSLMLKTNAITNEVLQCLVHCIALVIKQTRPPSFDASICICIPQSSTRHHQSRRYRGSHHNLSTVTTKLMAINTKSTQLALQGL